MPSMVRFWEVVKSAKGSMAPALSPTAIVSGLTPWSRSAGPTLNLPNTCAMGQPLLNLMQPQVLKLQLCLKCLRTPGAEDMMQATFSSCGLKIFGKPSYG